MTAWQQCRTTARHEYSTVCILFQESERHIRLASLGREQFGKVEPLCYSLW
jgi:hypothetical protein